MQNRLVLDIESPFAKNEMIQKRPLKWLDLSNETIPIFIITFERHSVLKEAIESYKKYLKQPFDIIIHDMGTTYPESYEYIKSLEKEGILVNWIPKQVYQYKQSIRITLMETVKKYFDKTKNPCKYCCVTDPDIVFHENTPKDSLNMFASILNSIESNVIGKVGPMLIWNDIPDHFPFKERVLQTYAKRYGTSDYGTFIFKKREIKYQTGFITPFGMYRRELPVYYGKIRSFRINEPYNVRHLDWYHDFNNLTPDQYHYSYNAIFTSKDTAHWTGEYVRKDLK